MGHICPIGRSRANEKITNISHLKEGLTEGIQNKIKT